jgi:hypothetical protein
MNKTLYKRLEDICAREYVVNKLTKDKFRTFVDFLYDDIRTWDNPTEVSDNDVMYRIEEHLSHMVARILTNTHTGTAHD